MSQIGFNAGGGCGVSSEPCCIKEVKVVDNTVTIVLGNGNTFTITPEQIIEAYGDKIINLIQSTPLPIEVFDSFGVRLFSAGV